MRLCVLLRSAKLTPIGNNTLTDNQNISFLPAIVSTSTRMHGEFCVFFFYRPTGRPKRTSLPLECHRNAISRNHSGPACGILPRPEEQSRTCGCQSSSVEDQPQCPGLWHSSNPNARSLSHSPSAPPPSFTQSACPPRSLVRDGQTSPHRPRLVVSRSTCPPLSPYPHADNFIIGTAVINTHTTIEGPGAPAVKPGRVTPA